MSSRHVFKTSSTRLQRNNFSSSKTSCKMSSRRLQDVLKDVKLLRCFKTSHQDVLKKSSRPTCLLVMYKHYNDIRDLKIEYNKLTANIQLKVASTFSKITLKSLEKSLHKQRIESFTKKNKKIYNLLKSNKDTTTNYTVPIINLSSYLLIDAEYNQLKSAINHSLYLQIKINILKIYSS